MVGGAAGGQEGRGDRVVRAYMYFADFVDQRINGCFAGDAGISKDIGGGGRFGGRIRSRWVGRSWRERWVSEWVGRVVPVYGVR